MSSVHPLQRRLLWGLFVGFIAGHLYAAENCSLSSFGAERVGALETFTKVSPRKATHFPTAKGPFNRYPPEVGNLRRGIHSNWVGAFINDGLSSWDIIDLDELELVRISTQVWDKRSGFTRPFDVNKPVENAENEIVRTWIADGGERYERQVVTRTKLNDAEIEEFVCLANNQWRSSAERKWVMKSDSFPSYMYLRWWDPEGSTVQEKVAADSGPLEDLIFKVYNRSRSSK